MEAWSRKNWFFCENFALFWKNDPLQGNFQNSVLNSPPQRSTCYFFGWRKIGKVVRYLPDKEKILPGSPVLATARIAPKIFQGQPQTTYSDCSRFHPNRFTFGGVIRERVNTVKTGCKVFPIFGWSLASSRITTAVYYYTRFASSW